MPRKATGTVRYHAAKGAYQARLTLPDGTRPWIDFDCTPRSPQQEARAKERAAAWGEQIRAGTLVIPAKKSEPKAPRA